MSASNESGSLAAHGRAAIPGDPPPIRTRTIDHGRTTLEETPRGLQLGRLGPDDQRGRLNLLTPEKVLQGIAEVREGLAFCLSLPLDYPGGNAMNVNRLPPILRPLLRKGGVNMNYQYQWIQEGRPDVLSDDLAILHLQYSTQWDALSHVGALFDANDDGVPEPLYYNGFSAGGDVEGPSALEDCGIAGAIKPHSTSCAHALGIERMAETCVQGRGVMIDLHHHFGLDRTHIGYDELMRVLEADRVEVEAGDIVCLHTGYAEALLGMNRNPRPGSAGAPGRRARWQRQPPAELDHRQQPGGHRRRQLLGGNLPRRPRRRLLLGDAAAPPLPVQARRTPGRTVAPHAAGQLAARQRPQPLPAHRPAAAPARRRRRAAQSHRHRLTEFQRAQRTRTHHRRRLRYRRRHRPTLPRERL
ncbi:cyclase family protein [Pseudomonas aeruginosa]|uniref:cyclase family protein n=1 Tax=Pseudomonas aeruginosa TaxID=287 RepID=UPI0037B792EF